MSLKDQKDILISILESLFGKVDKITFFLLKKEKVTSKSESIIPFKTRRKVDQKRIKGIENLLKKSTGDKNLRLIRWSEVINKIVPNSRVFKIPFFDSENVETKSHPWRLCPVGEHWVRRHPKHLNSGKITDHDGPARGLIQITESTRKILQDLNGEIKNHHIKLSIE